MGLQIYNTMTGQKEDFAPIKEGEVGMYVCGVTVYDFCHIGHARAAIVFDTIFNYLKYIGYKVNYVRNFTDVDDKIIKRANEEGSTSHEVAERYIKEFYTDMNSLGISIPTHEPKATEHIPEMILLIQKLMENGLAYEANGDVLYSVRNFKGYGKLSKKNMDELESGARVEVGEHKKDPLDFVLWKASKPGEPMWDSPWGKGRPGWHIECSAMGTKFLGKKFDIHGGGRDLIFPHHENELAQSEGANGVDPVNYWVHNGFVNINKEKMSKSLGNFFTIREITKQYDPETIRFFLLSGHYRSPIDFSDQNLKEAKINLDRFYDLLLFADKQTASHSEKFNEELKSKFCSAMDDDFNSAAAIGHLNNELRVLNGLRDKLSSNEKGVVHQFWKSISTIKECGKILGLFNQNPSEYFEKDKIKHLGKNNITTAWIESKIEERIEARKEKRWADADKIRVELLEKGITLLDSKKGTEWKLTSCSNDA